MRSGLIIGLGICAAATTVAFAQERVEQVERMVIRAHSAVSDLGRIDADRDGWMTRAEASAEAERMFGEMDTNDDGRLDGEDHRALRDIHIEHAAPGAPHRVEHSEERRVVVIERRVDGEGGPVAVAPPAPPAAPRPPVFVMMIGNSEEFDANGDGALSLAEFRTQQLRYFDAGDGNGDGRVRFAAIDMPEAPEPPAPPAPPAPPRR